MHIRQLSLIVLLFASLACAALALAGVPQTINYQGYLTTSGGTPVNGPLSMTFSLYSSNPARNNPVWRESRSVTPVNGIYSVQLGEITPITAPFDVAYLLGLQVDTDPEMALQPLASVPYAMTAAVAENADSLSGQSLSQLDTRFVNTSGSYSSPAWLASLSGSKISGNISGSAANVTGVVPITNGGTGSTAKIFVDTINAQTVGGDKVFTNGLTLGASYTGTGKTGEIRLRELEINGINHAGFRAPDSLDAIVVWTLPSVDGANGQMLTTNGSRILSWQTPNSGTVTSVSAGTGLFGGTITGNGTIDLANTAVTPGNYNRANITVDAQGRLTAATSNSSVNLASEVSGTLPVANGGTGTTTVGTAGQYLRSNGTAWSSSAIQSTDLPSGNGSYIQNQTAVAQSAGFNISGHGAVGGNLNLSTASKIYFGTDTLIHAYGDPTNNFFVGINAGNLTTTGTSNTAIGHNVLVNSTTGNYNTAIGERALVVNSAGNHNTATGNRALVNNSTGNDNTANGSEALTGNSTGFGNTAIGRSTLYYNSTGYYNTANGKQALQFNSSGQSNTATGAWALSQNTTGNYNTGNGYNALALNTSGTHNAATGDYALYSNKTGGSNAALGYNAGYNYSTGSNNTFVGASADAATNGVTNATALGSGAIVDASNHIRIGNTSVTQIGGQVAWSNLSDVRIKNDISDISVGLDFIRSLRPVEYRLINGNERTDFGFIAQDVETLVGTGYNILGIGNDADRTLSLRYSDFIAPLVKAIQEQQAVIDGLKSELAEIRKLLGR